MLEVVLNCDILYFIWGEIDDMINEEKVILMTKASLYEEKEKKKSLKIMKYFRYDYISIQLLSGWFFGTISFLLCFGLWVVCNMEYLMNNLHKMDLESFGLNLLLMYVCGMLAYLCILCGVSIYRYQMAKKSVSSYQKILWKISNVYAQEEKPATVVKNNGGRKV